MQGSDANPPTAIFVVLLRDVLVARDIEMIIADTYPEAKILVAWTLEDAALRVPEGKIRAAFVQVDARDFATSELRQRVASDCGSTVFVDCEPDAGLPVTAWSVLPFPFAQANVAALLKAVAHA